VPQQPGLALAIGLVALLGLALAASMVGRLRRERQITTASLRAVVQLALVSLVITAVLSHIAWSAVFALVMYAVAVYTSAGRIDARGAWPWVAVAIAAGVVPVLAVIFASGAVPLNGP
jgi:putative ABC transport system permease protein